MSSARLLGIASLLAALLGLPTGSALRAAGDAPAGAPVVLLELFTSQGCSSCPPADRLLSRIGQAGELEGVRVVPLAYHVDYWDRIGWKDPFSAPEWSARQRSYGEAFGLYSVYTPQVVVSGRDHAVGSDESRLRELVATVAGQASSAEIALGLEMPAGGAVRVSVTPRVPPDTPTRVMVALYENDLVTEVRSGENARRTLHEDYVVRRLAELPPGATEIGFRLEPSWATEHLGVVAFVQDTRSLAILAVDSGSLSDA